MERYQESILWDLLIALRLYIIILLIIPIIFLSITLYYVQPLGIIILGFLIILIIRFVLFEPRTAPKWFLKGSIAIILPIACVLFLNFFFSFIINLFHSDVNNFFIPLIICISSVFFFIFTVPKKRFKAMNSRLISLKIKRTIRRKYINVNRHLIPFGVICWAMISMLLIFVPYPVYIQNPPNNIENQKIGIWVGSGTVNESSPYYLSNETLELLSDKNIYLSITVKNKTLGNDLAIWLTRCKDFNIEVHLSLSVTGRGEYFFVNMWTYKNFTRDIENIIEWFNASNFLGDPVTTIVYDMETITIYYFFEYFFHSEITNKLVDFYKVKKDFADDNNHLRKDYNLDVKLWVWLDQGMDFIDGDDDFQSLFGLMYDDKATRSYMIYRKDYLGLNYVVDCCRLFHKGDTICINSWGHFKGSHTYTGLCYQDLDCVIEEARLVLGYPGKNFNLEIWRIDNFIDSYSMEGLIEFVEAVTENPSNWPLIIVWYIFPHSPYSDGVFLFYSFLDLYAPLLRILYHVY